ncbi:TIGR03862 family flavoprotein [Pseudochrobactrum sp. B5]|uniref:TIGR03862 family flavoprotein n=1 Tax=Pseudochrobactrum sp. B5 TaxID=1289478 RepID=UPI0011152745|nr:TIGR03862 family flavoprotein [Pseudochrobactrum sp. B5]
MNGKTIAIIGGGPSGLAAAEILSAHGHDVTVYEAMPTVARKFLLAGKSGLNITHSEPYGRFRTRYGSNGSRLIPALDAFTPADICQWTEALDIEVFTGSSGRVFPKRMKASPLLRNWVARLEAQGIKILKRHRWKGFSGDTLLFDTPEGEKQISPDATLLALGGASYPRLGSDATWVPWLKEKNISIAPLQSANCGFDVDWSTVFRERFAGAPIKSVAATSPAGRIEGEFVISQHGIEGSLIYAHTAALRDQLNNTATASLYLDLTPARSIERLIRDFTKQGSKSSFSNRLRKATDLEGVKAALLRELVPDAHMLSAEGLAQQIKNLAVPLLRPRPIAEAISSAGGIVWDEVSDNYMLHKLPGVFVAGEMLDWEAPTGGYLLTACFATGRAAARGMLKWLQA